MAGGTSHRLYLCQGILAGNLVMVSITYAVLTLCFTYMLRGTAMNGQNHLNDTLQCQFLHQLKGTSVDHSEVTRGRRCVQ